MGVHARCQAPVRSLYLACFARRHLPHRIKPVCALSSGAGRSVFCLPGVPLVAPAVPL
ncbi:hypothetical protein CBM2585_A40012 [Cupriavidus taiwanensis]|nr:hypothetical protein CBM2585_A40012 [Cupriavidus taiwanensis]